MAVPLAVLDLRYFDRAYRRSHLRRQLRNIDELPGLIEQPSRIEERDAPQFQPHPILRNLRAVLNDAPSRGQRSPHFRIPKDLRSTAGNR